MPEFYNISKQFRFSNIFFNLKKGGYFIFDVQGEGELITDFLNQLLEKNIKQIKT